MTPPPTPPTPSSTAPPHVAILASAGTGKTFALTSRYLRLVASGESPERILATTFTRKAAGEILRKIVARLAEAAADPSKTAALAQQIAVPTLTPGQSLRLLATLCTSLDRLSIGTIDSFFSRIAAGFSLTLGAREWRMIDADEDAALRAEAVSHVLRSGDRAELMALVRRHRPGAADRSVHALMLAAVDDAYQEYLRSDRDAWSALIIDPPLDPADLTPLLSRLRAYPLPTTKTGSPNKNWSSALAAAIEFTEANNWDAFLDGGLIKKVMAGETSYSRLPIDDPLRDTLDALIAHAVSSLLAPLPDRTLAAWQMLHRFDHAYRALKLAGSVCTFDDIPRMLLESSIAGTDQSLQEMYYRLDARIRHVLLDEFQDTSVVQWRLLEPLVAEIVSQGVDRSLLCVGDEKQSLYGWRRAEPELLASIPRRWPHINRELLTDSWRSSRVVIDLVNTVMGALDTSPLFSPERTPGDADAAARWKQMFQPHSTHKHLAGACRLVVSPDKSDTESHQDAALRVAAERIAHLHRLAPRRSIGVLFRSRKHIAPMKMELARHDIHASEEGGNPLTDSPAVAAALSLLLLADHPGNTAAHFHVASSPLGAAVGLTFPCAPSDVCATASDVRRRLASGLAPTLESWLRAIAPHCSTRDARRFDQLIDLATRFDERSENDPATRPSAFVAFVESQRVEDPTAAPVRLMTIHASKGLEFDTVVLPWLDDRIGATPPAILEDRDPSDPLAPPTLVTLCPKKELATLHPTLSRLYARWRSRQVLESLCVLYVALTRAIHSVELFVPPSDKTIADSDAASLSFAKILRAALAPDTPAIADTVLWTSGDPHWLTQAPATDTPPPTPPPPPTQPPRPTPSPPSP